MSFKAEEIKKIYEKYPEIKEKEKTLEKVEKKIIDKLTKKEINQIEKLVIKKKVLIPQEKIQNNNDVQEIMDYLFGVIKKRGIVTAIETVKKMHNPFILDNFHDQLIEKGFLEETKGK